jgi:hypothetical protein
VEKSRRMNWAGHVAHIREKKGAYRILVWRPVGRRQLGRPRRRWEDNIKIDLHEVGCRHGLDRADSVYGQVAGCCEAVINLRFP